MSRSVELLVETILHMHFLLLYVYIISCDVCFVLTAINSIRCSKWRHVLLIKFYFASPEHVQGAIKSSLASLP